MCSQGLIDRYINFYTASERPRVLQDKVFEHLFEVAEIAKYDRKEMYEYEESLKNYRDWYSVMQTAEIRGLEKGIERGIKQGIKQGIEQGIDKGIEKGRTEIARTMLAKGMNIRTISELTGLSVDEISQA